MYLKKFTLFFLIIGLFSGKVASQNTDEKTNLKFQEMFFNALTEKAIKNYGKAIDKLSVCNELIPNNKAVLFELSKNYMFDNKYPEAAEYANQALKQDSKNIWILNHLVNIYKHQRNFNQAITTQKIIIKDHPKEKEKLVFLHLHNNDKPKAKKVLDELAEAKMLTRRLRNIKSQIFNTPKKVKKVLKTSVNETNTNLKDTFEKNKSFTSLKKLLLKLDANNDSELLKYSENGLSLFPAQPFVYLMNGKALNKLKKYKKGIYTLSNGVDFIIDDKKMKNKFHKEFIKAYKGLGDKKNERKYIKKMKS